MEKIRKLKENQLEIREMEKTSSSGKELETEFYIVNRV